MMELNKNLQVWLFASRLVGIHEALMQGTIDIIGDQHSKYERRISCSDV